MRDFRDAKAMAQTLRESLTAKAINVSHSESLELVSKMLGVSDWNTLSALLQTDQRTARAPAATLPSGAAIYPAIPLRDLVPFPAATYPLFVGREKTVHALNDAFARQREVVLAIQRDSAIDEPRFEDIYEVGVLAQLLELEPMDGGTLKVLAQVHRRVLIRRFAEETGAFQAEVAELSEGPIPDLPELIRKTVQHFESYAAARGIRIPQVWPQLEQTRDPGRVADIIASRIKLPIPDKQSLLAMLDPETRLKRVDAHLDLSSRPLSAGFEATQRRALSFADQRHHEYATLEHLLLALIDDADASAAMEASGADLSALKASLLDYLDNELKHIVIENGAEAKPTAAFQRTSQRAALHAQEPGRTVVTGADLLVGLFPETQSPAARLLGQHGVSRARAVDFVARRTGG